MKRTSQLLGLTLLGALALVSCTKDTTPDPVEPTSTVRMDVQPVYGTSDLYLDSTYTTTEGYKVQFTDIKFYLENPRNGSVQMTDAMLFDYRERGTLLYSGEGDAADFSSFDANLGVQSSLNHNDPSAFDNASWLNISNSNDMHWDWNPGYIFVKIEGKVDTIPDATDLFDQTFVFHCGLDANLQTISLSNLSWTKTGDYAHSISLNLDMEEFLNTGTQAIDLKTENSSHSAPGQEALTLKVMENFKAALMP